MSAASTVLGGRMVLAAAFLAAGVAACAPAHAAPLWMKRAFGARGGDENRLAAMPPAARYRIEDGGLFVLDRSGVRPFLKFDDSAEVWVLTASRGPRGDLIYLNDSGAPLLRLTRLGGLTVFTSRRPEGAAAALSGACQPLRLVPVGAVGLYQRLFQASVRSSRAAGRVIGFDAPDADAASDGLIADAAQVAGEAFVALSARAGGKALLARISRIDIEHGRQPGANLRAGVLQIFVTPAEGLAGRPSSIRILRAVGAP